MTVFCMCYISGTKICFLIHHQSYQRLVRNSSNINYLTMLTFLLQCGIMPEFKMMVMIVTIEWMLFGATYLH